MRATSKMSAGIIIMLNYRIRDLLFHCKISLLFWLLFLSKSVEIHYSVQIRSHILHFLLTLYGEMMFNGVPIILRMRL